MQGVQAPPPGSAGAAGGDYKPPAEVRQLTHSSDLTPQHNLAMLQKHCLLLLILVWVPVLTGCCDVSTEGADACAVTYRICLNGR